MVDLVQQASRILLLFLITSCVSTIPEREVVKKSIIIDSKKPVAESTIENRVSEDKIESKILVTGSISSMLLDGSDLWIGKLGGALLRYNIYTKEAREFYSDEYSVVDFSVKKIEKYKNYIVSLQSNRIQVVNTINQSSYLIPFPNGVARGSDLEIYNDEVLLSTLGYGIWKVDLEGKQVYTYYDRVEFISSIKVIKDQLYIGSMRDGLYIWDGSKTLSRINLPVELFRKNITSIDFDKDIFYFGTAKSGLLKWDMKNNIVERIYNGENVTSIYISEDYNAISFMGYGVLLERKDSSRLESIKGSLLTNNITSVTIHDRYLLTGNLKKGLIQQEIIYD